MKSSPMVRIRSLEGPGVNRLVAAMPLEVQQIEALLSTSAPHLLGEPLAERARSVEKTVWSIGRSHIIRRANAVWVRPLFLRGHRLLPHLQGRVALGVP